MTGTGGRIGFFGVDVNGPSKGPNIWGRDFFGFDVFPTLGIKPYGGYTYNTGTVVSNASLNAASGDGCNPAGGKGFHCAAKVISEGAMSY